MSTQPFTGEYLGRISGTNQGDIRFQLSAVPSGLVVEAWLVDAAHGPAYFVGTGTSEGDQARLSLSGVGKDASVQFGSVSVLVRRTPEGIAGSWSTSLGTAGAVEARLTNPPASTSASAGTPTTEPSPPHAPVLFPSVLRRLAPAMPAGPLYHYTTQVGFLGVLDSGELWATAIPFLNDSKEYIVGLSMLSKEFDSRLGHDETLRDLVRGHLSASAANMTLVGVVSFSARRDDLSQWRAYSGGSGGFAFGFSASGLMRSANERGAFLLPVTYVDPEDLPAATAAVGELCDELIADARLVSDAQSANAFNERAQVSIQVLCSVLKDKAFADENEWRVLIFGAAAGSPLKVRQGKSMPTPYFTLNVRTHPTTTTGAMPLGEVLVGPNPHPDLARQGAILAMYMKGVRASVASSRVPFRNW